MAFNAEAKLSNFWKQIVYMKQQIENCSSNKNDRVTSLTFLSVSIFSTLKSRITKYFITAR